jgi:hypothetical protein
MTEKYHMADPNSVVGVTFEGLSVLSVERVGNEIKVGWGEAATKPGPEGRVFVLAREAGGEYTVPNSLIEHLRVGDLLWWKDEASYQQDMVNLRAAQTIDAANKPN